MSRIMCVGLHFKAVPVAYKFNIILNCNQQCCTTEEDEESVSYHNISGTKCVYSNCNTEESFTMLYKSYNSREGLCVGRLG